MQNTNLSSTIDVEVVRQWDKELYIASIWLKKLILLSQPIWKPK